jgi:hypothetical protein
MTRFARLGFSAAVLLLKDGGSSVRQIPVLVAILIASVASVAVPAHAAGTCTNATLIGAYGFQEQGQAIGAGFSDFSAVGVTNFNGKGNGSRSFTIWYSDFSVVSESDVAISYNVQSDCRFTFTYLSNGEIFSGVIVQNGRKLLYLETSGDPMRSGQAEKVKVDN